MGILDIFKRTEKRGVEDATLTTPTVGGTGLSFSSLLQGTNGMALSTLFRCVNIISDSVAVLPINVLSKDGTKLNHSLDLVFRDSNNRLTKFELIKMLIQSVILKGNGFCYIERNGDGSVSKLRFLESGDVSIQYTKNNEILYYNAPIITQKRIEPVNMIHLKIFSYDGINGISILNIGSRTIKMANTTEQSALNYFDSGCNLAGVLSVASSLTPQQIKDIKQAWMESYTSGNNGIAVLQGNMQFQSISQNGVQSQMLESREYMVKEICRLFGISPLLLGESSTYGNIEAAQNEFVLHTLLPYIVAVEQEFSRKLLKPSEIKSGLEVNLDESYLMRTDKQAESNYLTTLTNAGIISVNEAREKIGYKPVEGGDELRIPFSDANQNKLNQSKEDNNE